MKYRLATLALSLAGSACAAAPEFSIETVLQSLAAAYPHVSRVADDVPAGVIARENLTYVTRDGTALQLDLYRPEGTQRLPGVLIVHGGGWIAGDRRMERPFAKQLAARGYVAATVSYRLGRAGRFPAPLQDLRAAIRWLRAHAAEWHVDSEHLGLVGGSAGGTLAATLGAMNGDAIGLGETPSNTAIDSSVQAVVDVDGTVTFMDNRLIEMSETQPSPYWEYVHGPYNANRATWLAASPLNHVTRASAPTLFIKSTASQPVLAGREEMLARLRILGVAAEEITLPDTPHPFWLVHPWFERVLEATDAFLQRHLKPGPR